MIVRNNITEVAYNTQTTVDEKNNFPIDYKVTNENDSKAMGNMLQRAKTILRTNVFTSLYDKGYHTGSEFKQADDLDIDVLVAIPTVAAQAPNPDYNVEHFTYNEKDDYYLCPQGNMLKTTGTWHKAINASIQSWEDDWKYRYFNSTKYEDPESIDAIKTWHKDKSFIWKGELNPDGSYKSANPANTWLDDYEFDWSDILNNSTNGWEKIAEITRIDRQSVKLEIKDINGSYISNKQDHYDNIIVEATNTQYTDFAYSGAEDGLDANDYFGGEVRCSDATVYSTDIQYVHTGNYSVIAAGSEKAFEFINWDSYDNDKKYVANVWIHSNNIDNAKLKLTYLESDGSTVACSTFVSKTSETVKAGNWYLLEIISKTQAEESSIADAVSLKVEVYNDGTGSIYCDDFRVHPFLSTVETKVYDQGTGLLIAEHDNDNFGVKNTIMMQKED